jgi:hypothetical protein
MAAPLVVTPNADLDYLLAEVAAALQLTPEQYRLAGEHYLAVGDWLAAPGSILAKFRPRIYPQGSMALETTVRPKGRDEYDLDLVCQMLPTGMSALNVYNEVYGRLMANRMYAPMVEKKNRCVRLNYAHQFHLDIIPAEPDQVVGGDAIRVPDRDLRDWTPSNPRGYVAWFTARSRVTIAELRKRVDPLPNPTPVSEKPALTIAVQLMKRRRDMLCDAGVAPRSIVLTTLAAEYYRGTDCVLTALAQIVAGIQQRIQDAKPGCITVCNPTNPAERFCESFEPRGRYASFTWFITQLERDVIDIASASGLGEIEEVLAAKFGPDPATRALKSYGQRLRAQRDSGNLRFAGTTGLSIVTESAKSRAVPSNRYFGGGDGQ